MGLANLVPGISGGTMLLAAGVYPTFIASIAKVTTLKIEVRSLLTLGTIAVCALLAILLLAGTMLALASFGVGHCGPSAPNSFGDVGLAEGFLNVLCL